MGCEPAEPRNHPNMTLDLQGVGAPCLTRFHQEWDTCQPWQNTAIRYSREPFGRRVPGYLQIGGMAMWSPPSKNV